MQRNFREELHLLQAYKRVESIKKFYLRLGVYCGVNAIFLTVWLLDFSLPSDFWMPTLFFTTFIAGLFVLSNAILVFGKRYILTQNWEEKKIKELIYKEKQQITKYE